MESMKSVAIIGAGMGGLTVAIKLQQLGNFKYTIYEKGPEIGGTWRDNTYPGASSDVGIHFYCLSTDLNPNWTHTLGSQQEIQDYWISLAKKYDLYPSIVFNTCITGAQWDDKTRRYEIQGKNVLTGEAVATSAEILISATGILEQVQYPEIPGLSSFRGALFHSARWDHDVSLEDQRVGVIGNGASASQFMPLISQVASAKITQFIRTPTWFLPPRRSPFSSAWKWAFTNIPVTMRLFRLIMFFQGEFLYMIFASKFVRKLGQMYSERYIRQNAPAQYLDRLIPNYSMGCKRMVFDTDYFACLHRPNVSLSMDGISAIVEDGIITKSGQKIALDTIILATGFNAHVYPITIRGRSDQTVQDYYNAYGAPRAYLGTTLPGFPNFYMISGPNTATGHTSVLYSEELQADYCLALMLPVLQGKVSAFEVTPEATDAFNDWLQARLSRSVFTQCHSWYRKGGDGINSAIFPGSQFLHWWILRKPVWSHYNVVDGTAWVGARRGRAVGVAMCAMTLLILAIGIYATSSVHAI